MLTPDLLKSIKTHTEKMTHDVVFVLQLPESDKHAAHEKREELRSFLSDLASCSDRLSLIEEDAGLRSPISFSIRSEGKERGIHFSGIPGGHEFTSLVLAMLQSGGVPLKLDESVQDMAKAIDRKLKFDVYISLSCHNCPDVVQALHQFALLNDHIESEMIDGALFQDLVDKNNIQGVPSVFLNGEPFANGKIDVGSIVEKLIEKIPAMTQTKNADEELEEQDVTVIGSGPAGVSAAIYAARKGIRVTLIGDRFGGQVKDTMGIENLISVSKTTGPELVGAMHTHLGDYEVNRREHLKVTSIEKAEQKGGVHRVHLSSGEVIKTKTIVIATGAKWRELNVKGEKENIGNGVAYCPHCDGPFFKGKRVSVIGGGNSGVEAALDLAGIVKHVTLVEFAPELKADQILVDQMMKRDNIDVIKNAATQSIQAEAGKVISMTYQDRASQKNHDIDLSAVFIQIGLVPNSAFAKGVVEQTKYGEIIVNEKGETNVEGIYACGDVTTVPYKQIVIAMGEGAKAALGAFEYLLKVAA